MNSEGKVLFSYDIKESGEVTKVLDVRHLPDGVYFIQLISGEISETKKITTIH